MVNEIKFRGKSIKDGEWVYGAYVPQYHSRKAGKRVDAIFYSDEFKTYRIPVDSKTVGQYIKRKDKNDNEIYVGDVIRWKIKGYKMTNQQGGGWASDNEEETILIEDITKVPIFKAYTAIGHIERESTIEIISNKFENPALLKEVD